MTAAESSVRIRSGRSAFALRRPRLEERLDDVFGKRVGLVVAGAGYGKSTLVASWSEDLNAAWHVLGPTDSELASFLEKLLPALSRAGVAIAEELLAAVTSREPAGDELRQAEGFGALLCESLAVCLPHDLILVLDDLHELDPASASIRLIETLCRHCPEQLHLVLVSRAEPPFPIGRLRGQGEVLELAAADLVLSTGELKELVRRAFGSDAGQLAEALQELTGGWPAAARMAIERMRLLKPEEREAALVAMREPEGPLISYLAEEIFASEAPEVVRLLRTVAFFDRFTVSLCHALGLPAAAETLAGLVRRGFFVQAHDEWFTLHPLVREFAKRTWEIETEEAQDLHRRAAAWFEGNGELEKALAALEASSDWAQLPRVLSSRGAELLAAGSAESVIRYVEMIPEGVRDAAIERVLAEAHAIEESPSARSRPFDERRSRPSSSTLRWHGDWSRRTTCGTPSRKQWPSTLARAPMTSAPWMVLCSARGRRAPTDGSVTTTLAACSQARRSPQQLPAATTERSLLLTPLLPSRPSLTGKPAFTISSTPSTRQSEPAMSTR